jgi:hypothetical protein
MKTKLTLLLAGCIINLATSYAQNSWLLTGNSGTDSSKNFLGTTDAKPLVFRVNNQKAGYLDYDSLRGNTGFGYKSLVGIPPGKGRFNTAVGYQTLVSTRWGTANTAVGYQALFEPGYGSWNTGIGFQALLNSWRGYANTAIGANALSQNNKGRENTATGCLALFNNGWGRYNTASGYGALYSNSGGHGNTASGWDALSSNTDGNLNTAVGMQSGGVTTGNRNTALGYAAGVISGDFVNSTAIGSYAFVDASRKVRIGSNGVNSIGGQVGWTSFSDGRVKKDVKENVPGLAFITALRPVTYHFSVDKEDELMGVKEIRSKAMNATKNSQITGMSEQSESDFSDTDIPDDANDEGKYDIEKMQFTGFLAQDVDEAAQKIGYDFSGVDKTGKIWGLRYGDFVVPLVKAVQELSKENDELKSRLDKLEAALALQTQNVELGKNAKLEQNVPNPYNSITTISYYVPSNTHNPYINFYASNGALLKSVKLAGTGKGTINVTANELPSGAYRYSLMIDGKVVDSKQMVQAK